MLRAIISLLIAAVDTKKQNLENLKKKTVWVRRWLIKRHKYGMYEKIMKHFTEYDIKSFGNFARLCSHISRSRGAKFTNHSQYRHEIAST